MVKERSRYFIKVPELAAFYNEITDYRTAEDVGVDRPQKNEILHNIPPTPQHEERTAKLKADVPILQGIVAKTWGKEDELKQLKSELAALDRKIAAALAPKHDENDGEEIKRDETQQKQEAKTVEVQTTGEKKSLVAELRPSYDNDIRHSSQQSPGRFVASANNILPSGIRNSGIKF